MTVPRQHIESRLVFLYLSILYCDKLCLLPLWLETSVSPHKYTDHSSHLIPISLPNRLFIYYGRRSVVFVCGMFPLLSLSSRTPSLKNSDKFDLPVWADTVKTVSTRSWPSNGDDWYSHPAASIARKVYLRPGIGVGQLQKWREPTVVVPVTALSGGLLRVIIRSVLIQLEEMKVVEKVSGGGRRACCRTTGFGSYRRSRLRRREDDEE
jgi:small subunit ribosomal protein S19e